MSLKGVVFQWQWLHNAKKREKNYASLFFSLSLFLLEPRVSARRGDEWVPPKEFGQSWTRLTVPSAEVVCQRVFARKGSCCTPVILPACLTILRRWFLFFEVTIIGCQTKSSNWLNEGPVVESLSRSLYVQNKSRLNCFHFYRSTLLWRNWFLSLQTRCGKHLYLWYIFFYYTVKYLVSSLML